MVELFYTKICKTYTTMKIDSICAQETRKKQEVRSHILPIYPTSSFSFDSIDQALNIFLGKEKGHVYGRYGNPTVEAVADKIAQLETHGLDMKAKALMTSSGMSAISTLFTATLKSGDKVLTQSNIYGGTTELLATVLAPFGIEAVHTNLQNLNMVESLVAKDPTIKMIYFETPSNPAMICVDIESLASIARKHSRYSAIDNTFCTPYLQQPFKFGVDFIVHSSTKFLNGHGNAITGVIVGKDIEYMEEKVGHVLKLMGANCNPFDAWLVWNGMKTLSIRLDKQSANAMKVAQMLEAHPAVGRVNYNGLHAHPDYQIAKKQMRQFGAMLSFELNGCLQTGVNFIRKLRLCTLAPTLGDVDTLVQHPALMSHEAREVREQNGISDGLIRMSVGIENVDDILVDLQQALDCKTVKNLLSTNKVAALKVKEAI